MVQPWELRRMWVVSDRIVARWEPQLRFFQRFNSSDKTAGVATPTRVDVERNRDLRDSGGQQPEDGTTVDSNIYSAGRDKSVDADRRDQPHAARGRQDLPWFRDNATAALQLLSHLEGDALNVALLVPAFRRTSRVGLVGTLSAHYGSPGRLADYGRQFKKTTRGGPVHFRTGDIGHKGFWGHGPDGMASYYPRSIRSRTY